MPPRKAAAAENGAGLSQEQQQGQRDHLKLLDKALKAQVLVTPNGSQPVEPLQPKKALLKIKGKDIIKKSSTRKNRYMLVFNARLAPAAAGKLGTLAKLDTKNPVMYIDFPNGRLKFAGTLVFPRNKYMVLKTGTTADILCEDVFENLVVFSEACWVGTPEENPNEDKLPMPPELMAEKKHTNFDYCYGAGCRDGVEPTVQKLPSAVPSKPDEHATQEGAGTKRTADTRDGADKEEEPKVDDEEDDAEALAARQKRRKTGTDGSEPQDTAAPSTPAEEKEEKANEGKENGAAEVKPKQAASGSMDSPMKVDNATEEDDESPVVRGPSRSKKRKAVIEGTPSAGGPPEETAARRESLRRTCAKASYAEKSDEEQDDEDSGKASKGCSSPESDEEEKPLKQLQEEKAKRGRGARSTGRTPVKQQGGAASAPSTSKGDKGLKVDSDGAILLGSDDDTPAKPAAAKSAATKSAAAKPTATKSAAAKAAAAKPPPKAASKTGRKPKAETNQNAAASTPAGKSGAGPTIELLDDTPERPTPLSQRPVRSAGKTATKRLAALRDSGAGMQDDKSGKESEEEEADASASEDDGGDSDFNG